MRRVEALFVLNLLPHYRSGVFRELVIQSGGTIEIAGGTDGGPVKGILGLTDMKVKTRHLRNRHLGPFLWQSGVLSLIWNNRAVRTVVFTGDWKILSTWFAMLLCRCLGIRVALWTIGWHRAEKQGPQHRLRMAFYRMADGMLLYGRRAREIGSSLGYCSDRLNVVGNSYPLPDLKPQEVKLRPREIIYVGRLTPVKRIDLLIESVAAIQPNRRPKLVLVGDGPEFSRLRDMAAACAADVHFAGAVHDEEDLRDLYATARLTVIPGAAGLTVIQSLGFGVPVITHGDLDRQMPEVEAISSGITGELVNRQYATDFAETIESWLDLDDAEYERRSSECRRAYDNYWTPTLHAERILSAIVSASNFK